MAYSKIFWENVRWDYENENISLHDLAKRYKCDRKTIREKARKNNWKRLGSVHKKDDKNLEIRHVSGTENRKSKTENIHKKDADFTDIYDLLAAYKESIRISKDHDAMIQNFILPLRSKEDFSEQDILKLKESLTMNKINTDAKTQAGREINEILMLRLLLKKTGL